MFCPTDVCFLGQPLSTWTFWKNEPQKDIQNVQRSIRFGCGIRLKLLSKPSPEKREKNKETKNLPVVCGSAAVAVLLQSGPRQRLCKQKAFPVPVLVLLDDVIHLRMVCETRKHGMRHVQMHVKAVAQSAAQHKNATTGPAFRTISKSAPSEVMGMDLRIKPSSLIRLLKRLRCSLWVE